MATVLPLPLPRTEPGPQDFALARAIAKLSPESDPAWVRDIGPALAPAAKALERLASSPVNPIALHAVLNCLAEAVHLSEGTPDAVRSRQAQDALWEACMAADGAFPAGTGEAQALLAIIGVVSAVLRGEVPA